MKLVKVYSRTCGPCKVLENNLQAMGISYESVDIQSQQGEEIIDKYRILAVPTLILLDDKGKVVKQHTGVLNVEGLKRFIDE